MEVKSLISNLTEDALKCLKLSIKIAFDNNYQQVSIEHLMQAISVCEPDLLHEIYTYDTWLNKSFMDDLAIAPPQKNTVSDSKLSFSPSLVSWLDETQNYSREKWAIPKITTEALLFTFIRDSSASFNFGQKDRPSISENIIYSLEKKLKMHCDKKISINSPLSQHFVAIESFTHNITRLAKENAFDPISEREYEIRQMIDVLLRRRQNNPLLVGEPSVGKTALIEGLAERIISDKVPDMLKNNELLSLDICSLQAGAGDKGEFEKRIGDLLREIKSYPHPVILFIDEAHMMIGTGGSMGQTDIANLLKPMLARGEIRTIAATTRAEYKKYFEKDAALTRRFQIINIAEPSLNATISILRSIVLKMEEHHRVKILDEAVIDTVKLADRYITDRQFPDKAVSLLDTACARVVTSQSEEPVVITEIRSLLARNKSEQDLLIKDVIHTERIGTLIAEYADLERQLSDNLYFYNQQKSLVQAIRNSDDPALTKKYHSELKQYHTTHPFVFDCVDPACVADVVACWTGVPLGRMLENEVDVLMSLEKRLSSRIFSQDHAISVISRQIRISKSQLADPVKPVGVFMLVGPSGVGKTETALVLAAELYGGEHKLITFNMCEYQEAYSISGLKGAPPGYVGFGEGGTLTEAVRRQPYSVILLDEIEKAHPDVLELFFQVFDKGEMDDAEGRKVNFRNALFILTSNVSGDVIREKTYGKTNVDLLELNELVMRKLQQTFTPAFVGRTTVIPYLAANDIMLKDIIKHKLDFIIKRFNLATGASLTYHPNIIKYILACADCSTMGGREIESITVRDILPKLSEIILFKGGSDKKNQHISVDKDGCVIVN